MSALSQPDPSADLILPFLLEGGAVRGRAVRLSRVVDTILTRHAYPDAVSRLLAEALCVAAILSSSLKQEGIITLQMRGAGQVSLLVVDAIVEAMDAGGAYPAVIGLRGYADVAHPPPNLPPQAGGGISWLLGEDAYLAITYDPGRGMQRYQGVVALTGESLTEALGEYFTQSQQLDVVFRLAVRADERGWSAGGMMLERVADAGGSPVEDPQESWQDARAFLATVQAQEMTDAALPLDELLFRLFHQVGVRAAPALRVATGCRCSRARISDMLMSMAIEERAEMVVEGAVSVHCQFCNTTEQFTPEEIGLAGRQ